MLVSLNWLKQYVDYGALTPEELGEKITKSGIEVDGIDYIASTLENVVVGHVESCEQHPNADKLKVCQVNVGSEKLQIICGAPNVAQNQLVAVAKPGAVLPGDFKIKKVKLRGIESNGMICSLQELGIDEKYVPTDVADGIFVCPEDATIGADVTDLLNLDDAILEFDLTPNRADCLSMIGVAYEVAAILDLPIKLPNETVHMTSDLVADHISVRVEDESLTPYYRAFIVKDLEIKPAPLWMRNYLIASGIRPINNVVDITNYVLLEYGQPLHAFDFDLLDSNEIFVRRAKENETIITLDDKERKLTPDQQVITDGKNPVALAGVMGGASTEVHDQTSTILLEAAYFNPQSVRATVQYTGLRSESSTRLEKGVDPNRIYAAGLRACRLLEKYANGKVLGDPVGVDVLDKHEKTIKINSLEINKRLGTEISTEEMGHILTKLKFTHDIVGADLTVSIPTRRGDVEIFEDMLEEVARIYGYDNLPFTLPANASQPGKLSETQKLRRAVKNYLQSAGLMETITYSLTNKQDSNLFVSPEIKAEQPKPVKLAMPMSEDHQYLRVSILPELLRTLSYNSARSERDIAYYEMGSIFLTDEAEITKQPAEKARLSGAITGSWQAHDLQQENKVVDFYLVKGIVEGLFNFLNMPVTFAPARLDHMHPGRCAQISQAGKIIGFLGQIHPTVAKKMNIKETYVFDLNMETILSAHDNSPSYSHIPKYPSITRDIAFIVDQSVLAGQIKAEINSSVSSLVKQIDIFDVYTGKNLPNDKKSIAYRLHFQHPERTLKDREVDELYNEITDNINEKFHAYVRTE